MISAEEKELFQTHGLLRVENFLPVEMVTKAREAMMHYLSAEGLWRGDGSHLESLAAKASNGPKVIASPKVSPLIGELITDAMRQATTELADGQGLFAQGDYPHILFTPPNATEWFVPHSVWHVDVPRMPNCPMPGVQIFTFLDRVVTGGGGTLVVAGSHRFVNENRRISSADVKRKLKHIPYFRDLFSATYPDRQRFLSEPVHVDGVDLQIVELVGKPGDVYFTDMRVLHNAAPNAAQVPRLMLTHRFLRDSLRGAV